MGGLCGGSRTNQEDIIKRKPKPRKTLVNIELIKSSFYQDFQINKKIGMTS